ncbi:hypothetical protein [Chitinimonas sp. BJB300]|uniref:hypothetical protein n=1 Tax=Chitinimonas sp. BJB300 TaxID=1559339 RepID=UPI0026D04BDD
MLPITGSRQAGPNVPHTLDSGFDLAGLDQVQCATLADLLNRNAVLIDRAEVLKLKLFAIGIVVARQQLIAPRCG